MRLKYHLYMVLSGVLLGNTYIFSALLRNEGISTIEQMFFPMLFTVLLIFPIIKYKKLIRIKREDLKQFSLIGSTMALGSFCLITSILIGTPVAVAALLMFTFPIYTAIFGKIFLKEDVGFRLVVAIILGILGVSVIVEIWNVRTFGTIIGPILALFSGFLFTPEFVVGRFFGKKKYHYITTSFWTYAFRLSSTAVIALFAILIYPNTSVTSFTFLFTPRVWLLFLGFAAIPFVIGRSFEFAALTGLRASPATIMFLTEPVTVPILGYIILGEAISYTVFIGGVLILIAAFLVMSEKG